MFFQGLAPLLKHRAVLLSISDLDDGRLRVIITPQAILPQKGETDENTALLTPLQLDGTPAELDAELAQNLGPFVDSHDGLKSNLAEVKVIHAETAALEKAAAVQKATDAKNKSKGVTRTVAQHAEEKAAEKKANDEKNKPPSLFADSMTEPQLSTAAPTPSVTTDEAAEIDGVSDEEIEAEIAEANAAAEEPVVVAEFPLMNTNYKEQTIGDFTLRAA